jgi:hypothetical protein
MLEVELSTLELRQETPLRRKSRRPTDRRAPDFDEKFDATTVFYDCFSSADRDWIILVGPPLFNLRSAVIPRLKRAFAQKWWSRYRHCRLNRCDLLWLRSPVEFAELDGNLFLQRRIKVQPNRSEIFRGRRVLLTLSKDNELHWIRDWIEFHVRNHGCDAVLFYDNASTKYSSGEVRSTIDSVRGVEASAVVDWPYKFGPQGWYNDYWDSDFTQYGVLEHARRLFLPLATFVINGDIDELLITKGREPIGDLLSRSRHGYLCYGGQWIENVSDRQDESRRHANFIYRSRDNPRTMIEKWTIAPQRTERARQWMVHEVAGARNDEEISAAVTYRHYRSITTNWKSKRWFPVEFDESKHVVDEEMLPWLDVFGARPDSSSAEIPCGPTS